MELSIDMPLLNALQDGVVLLNQAGQVIDFNRAARPWLTACACGRRRADGAHGSSNALGNHGSPPEDQTSQPLLAKSKE
jgi:hypothetical protein